MKKITLILLCFIPILAFSKVKKIIIKERSIVANGYEFGEVGRYEKIRGLIFYEIDPNDQANNKIIDLQFAPVNENGMVECSSTFLLLKPVDISKANGRLLYGVNNRGNLYILRNLNSAWGNNNPDEEKHFGNGFLMRKGYCVLWSGWNWDVIEGFDFQQFIAPIAKINGKTIRQKSFAEMVNNRSIDTSKFMKIAWGNSRCYPSANYPDNSNDVLTVRNTPQGKRKIIPNNQWSYAYIEDGKIMPDSTFVQIDTGFLPGKIYELIYEVENPKVVGLGFAAVRDILSFFKYETTDLEGNPNPLLDKTGRNVIQYNYIYGISQSGRFIAHMLYQGFHVDEKNRMAFDGARIQVAGGGKGGFNYRFAQPTHHNGDLESNYFPSDFEPFNYLAENDLLSGGSNDLLAIAKEKNKIPKIIITNHALEYWTRSASLIHTTIDGKKDASVHQNVRIYILNGAPHGSPWKTEEPEAEHSLSAIDLAPFMRASLVLLDEWVAKGIEPPASKYPRLDNGTLISASEHKKLIPEIPGMRHPGRNVQPLICDYGNKFWSEGIITTIPPKITGHYPTFVPSVDIDGNGTEGIRLIEIAVPLGTYQGFNPRSKEAGAPDYLNMLYGSFWPFAHTKEERVKNHDPRLSLEERYGTKEAYIQKTEKEANKLVSDRFLLKEDALEIIKKAQNINWPPIRLETMPYWK